MPTPASPTSADILRLLRGYPPVLGAMLLVDGVITLIMGGDATVTLGEVVAYLLLPPLAMFLVTQTTGGRRPNAVTLGVAVAGAAVLLASLFLLGGVHLVTLPPWVLALVGAVLLGVALFVMRLTAPTQDDERPAPPLLSPSEREGFETDEFGSAPREEFGSGGYGSAARDEYASATRDYDRPAEPEWPPSRRDEAGPSADETVHGLPRVPGHSAGPPEPEWPPRREPIGAPWAAESRPEPAATWSAESRPDPEPTWSAESRPAPEPTWSDNDSGSTAQPGWSAGPADREWPPAPAAEWPPRRDPEPAPAPAAEQRSWFDTDEADQPAAESSWSAGPPDGEWPPSERSYQSGRRSRHPDQ
ncbi:hypothetical protein [Virgisporangium aurantiacum]|uniref:Uncharacterized protein n=1 Tax=Virgisporangium aurantiacum TaxID=175570 RepID=A0A8J3Z602_9ACTN|nr:hypothetical protein [Virgisporangium aurantiacum]GIJ58051.1 hypothetical protein Vau01_055670 [Virgisporangium aurantiacum]